MCKITVLVAVYNAEPFLDKCLNSLLGQSLHDIQIICIDDCSTDHSLQILKEYAQRDSRIKVMKTPVNSGQAVARNLGLTIADGEYTTMLDSDDWYEPTTLQKAYNALTADAENDCVLLHVVMHDNDTQCETDYENRTDKTTLSGEEAFRLSLDWRIHGLYVVRTSLHKRYPYDTTCRLYSDDNTTRLHYLHSRKVVFCDGKYFYRQHKNSCTNSCSIKRFDYMEANLSMRRQLDNEVKNGNISHADLRNASLVQPHWVLWLFVAAQKCVFKCRKKPCYEAYASSVSNNRCFAHTHQCKISPRLLPVAYVQHFSFTIVAVSHYKEGIL